MRALVATILVLLVAATLAGISSAKIPPPYKNCKQLNKRYPHGVGRVGARDHTSVKPVTNFKRSNKVYKLAIHYNRGLDRDKDGIACEKR